LLRRTRAARLLGASNNADETNRVSGGLKIFLQMLVFCPLRRAAPSTVSAKRPG